MPLQCPFAECATLSWYFKLSTFRRAAFTRRNWGHASHKAAPPPNSIAGAEYEIEEVMIAGSNVRRPKYSEHCLPEEQGKECKRKTCDFVHEDQLNLTLGVFNPRYKYEVGGGSKNKR